MLHDNMANVKENTYFGVNTVPHPAGHGTPRLLMPLAVCTSATWAAGSSTYCSEEDL